jgi:hypothetical protein
LVRCDSPTNDRSTVQEPTGAFDGDGDDVDARPDRLRSFFFTRRPTLYTKENSDSEDLLWQQVLEQRALRAWLLVITGVIVFCTIVLVVVGIALTTAILHAQGV